MLFFLLLSFLSLILYSITILFFFRLDLCRPFFSHSIFAVRSSIVSPIHPPSPLSLFLSISLVIHLLHPPPNPVPSIHPSFHTILLLPHFLRQSFLFLLSIQLPSYSYHTCIHPFSLHPTPASSPPFILPFLSLTILKSSYSNLSVTTTHPSFHLSHLSIHPSLHHPRPSFTPSHSYSATPVHPSIQPSFTPSPCPSFCERQDGDSLPRRRKQTKEEETKSMACTLASWPRPRAPGAPACVR